MGIKVLILLLLIGIQVRSQERMIELVFEFTGQPPRSVDVSPLKYHKDFAYSMAFDDGLDDTFSVAYPLLNSLFYSDGCGNQVPFTAGLAWYSENVWGQDLHNGSPGYMTYQQVSILHDAGWDVMNHSFSHEANFNGIDYYRQINRNWDRLWSKTGIRMRYMVPPAGDTNYIQPALVLGYLGAVTSNSSFAGFPSGSRVASGLTGLRPVFWRRLLASDIYSAYDLQYNFAVIASTSTASDPLWWNDFTHRVIDSPYGASLVYADFEAYFRFIELEYGIPGKDNGWIASAPEVYDYLLVRQKIGIQYQISGNRLTIQLNYNEVLPGLRYADISLLVSGTTSLNLVAKNYPGRVSLGIKGDKQLVNVHFPASYFTSVDHSGFRMSNHQILNVFPNPVSDQMNIDLREFERDDRIILTVLSLEGKPLTVINGLEGGKTISINATSLNIPPGHYVLQVTDQTKILKSGRFILIK